MTRPFGVKGRKRKTREEKYDHDEEDDQLETQTETAKRVAVEDVRSGEEAEGKEAAAEEVENDELPGILITPSDQKSGKTDNKVIFILEKASLEVAKVGKCYQLLNSDDHANFLRKNNRNPSDYRPDIVHQALLMILDSPLNKAGRLHAVYVRTDKNVLIDIKPHVRLPRTFKRFAGIMLQLLQKLSIAAVGKREKLLRVIKNPVTQYLPVNSRRIGLSYSSEKLVDMDNYLAASCKDADLVFVVGAMAHGKINTDYTNDLIAISGYPLSAAYCITRICNALEKRSNIL